MGRRLPMERRRAQRRHSLKCIGERSAPARMPPDAIRWWRRRVCALAKMPMERRNGSEPVASECIASVPFGPPPCTFPFCLAVESLPWESFARCDKPLLRRRDGEGDGTSEKWSRTSLWPNETTRTPVRCSVTRS